ncbi:MAG: hypothetical protein HY820_30315 [Acidobacteria bacterium]|nr:hypothetical protein [Acidobacteriota bacterium]
MFPWKAANCMWLLLPLSCGLLACGRGGETKGQAKDVAGPREAGPPVSTVPVARRSSGTALYLRRYVEARESAFTILLPEGWLAEGGVFRVNPNSGPTNSVGAKIDFSVKKDAQGSVMLRFWPNFTYKDPRFLLGNFPIGSNYMGSMVYPVPDPRKFLTEAVFRKQRPDARNVEIVEQKPLPAMAERYRQRAVLPNVQFEAGGLTVTYDEAGVRFKEKMMAVIEFVNGQGMGMWTNRETTSVRAPEAEFDRIQPLLSLIGNSLKGNPEWVRGENRGAAQRAQNALATQRYLQKGMQETVDHRRETYAEMRHSSWLFLTGQQDYVNPHTGEVEYGSNEYKHRWVNGSGDVIYSDDPNYNPKWDPHLKGRSDYELSQVRP